MIVTIKCKAFSGGSIANHRVRVDGDDVRVWDSVAGHYTACHKLSAAARRKAIKMARESTIHVGDRVTAGRGEDRDTGTVDRIDGDRAIVRWDSLVATPVLLSDLRRI